MWDIFRRRRTIIMEEKDVSKVLSIVNKYVKITFDQGIVINNCGWEDDPTKWFMLLYSTNGQWNSISEELRHIESVETE